MQNKNKQLKKKYNIFFLAQKRKCTAKLFSLRNQTSDIDTNMLYRVYVDSGSLNLSASLISKREIIYFIFQQVTNWFKPIIMYVSYLLLLCVIILFNTCF